MTALSISNLHISVSDKRTFKWLVLDLAAVVPDGPPAHQSGRERRMRALLFGIILLGGCTPAPQLESGEYLVPVGSGPVGGARVRVDAAERQIVMLGGCSGHYIDYRLDGARLSVVEEAVTAEACFDGGPYADDVNNRVGELLNQRPKVVLTDNGFDLLPAAGGTPVSFVQTPKNARN